MKKAFLLGITSSFFFATTFLLNRSMHLGGGNWIWSGSLRYFFALPMIALLVKNRYGFIKIHTLIRTNPMEWLLWSTIGFGFFYAPLCFASDHGESWMIASTWQLTIVMGILLTPFFHQKIPCKNLSASCIIFFGVLLLQAKHLQNLEFYPTLMVLIPILIGAISYPLGNRKMMHLCKNQLSTIERVYGMLLCSIPFWIVLSLPAIFTTGLPSTSQTIQAFGAALFSGVIATVLFFQATDSVKENQKNLALIESTQSGEVIFSLLGGIFLLGDAVPDMLGLIGIILIIGGMILNSLLTSSK